MYIEYVFIQIPLYWHFPDNNNLLVPRSITNHTWKFCGCVYKFYYLSIKIICQCKHVNEIYVFAIEFYYITNLKSIVLDLKWHFHEWNIPHSLILNLHRNVNVLYLSSLHRLFIYSLAYFCTHKYKMQQMQYNYFHNL